jgi:hypothetical protein
MGRNLRLFCPSLARDPVGGSRRTAAPVPGFASTHPRSRSRPHTRGALRPRPSWRQRTASPRNQECGSPGRRVRKITHCCVSAQAVATRLHHPRADRPVRLLRCCARRGQPVEPRRLLLPDGSVRWLDQAVGICSLADATVSGVTFADPGPVWVAPSGISRSARVTPRLRRSPRRRVLGQPTTGIP